MRKTNFIRIFSVAAAALCAALLMVVCGNPATGNDDEKEKVVKPRLSSLEVVYKDSSTPLKFNFDAEKMSYQLDDLDANATVIVTAAGADGADVTITVDGAPAGNPAEVGIPKAGAAGKLVKVTATKSGTSEPYSITMNPTQSNRDDDDSLQSLFIGYTENGGNLMTGPINGSEGTAQINDGSETRAFVIAKAGSSLSKITFRYDGDVLAKTGGTDNNPTTKIVLPDRLDSSTLEIVVTAGTGKSNTYRIKVNGFEPNPVRWQGAITCADPDYTVTKIVVKNTAEKTYDATPVKEDGGYRWTIETTQYYQPAFFLVSMEKEANGVTIGAQSKAFTLEGLGRKTATAAETSTSPILIPITDADIGVLIMDADQFYALLNDPTNMAKNFALGRDIDLKESAHLDNGVWQGPQGYAGQLYGNGHVIKNLVVKQGTGESKVGLFKTIGDGMEIYDIKIEVSNESPQDEIREVHFGGIVGATGNNSLKIKNVTVTGTIKLKQLSGSGFALVGGLIGETGANNGKTISIENCVSNVSFELGDGSVTSSYSLGFGGFIGKAAGLGNHTIVDSYSTGSIKIVNSGNMRQSVGALVGDATTTQLTISRCYAVGDITGENNATSSVWNGNSMQLYCGGLVGQIKDGSTVVIENSVALNPKVFALTSTVPTRAHYGRLYGGIFSNSANSVTCTNSFAWEEMLTGTDENAAAVENPADDNEKFGVQTNVGTATIKGINISTADLKKKETWTNTNTLGWDIETWDFKNIAADGRPKLK